ncbi:hypothetical protein BJ986_000201 [Phycicoccus badiiscoriae]|uniref:Uncharacterized protein n=1 Tax=Pedococcus badiiscoriae TaxID=642776 RepID=A0A852WGB7_9MICO|nr:hypothetical protein [Pedococcus badiiscoriae]NYG05714.1 hypothetical protein [Pedococcus badiiscoriae]
MHKLRAFLTCTALVLVAERRVAQLARRKARGENVDAELPAIQALLDRAECIVEKAVSA